MKKAILMSVTAACLAALSLLYLPATSASGSAKNEVTFNKDVASIFYNNCAVCHRPNDIAPMPLLSYKESRPWARSIKEKVLNREMPPWSPDPAFGEFSNDHRLAQKDIDTIGRGSIRAPRRAVRRTSPRCLTSSPAVVGRSGNRM